MDVAVPADYIEKKKKSGKSDKYLDFAQELRKLWNMEVMVILIVIGALGTIPKGSERRLDDSKIRR